MNRPATVPLSGPLLRSIETGATSQYQVAVRSTPPWLWDTWAFWTFGWHMLFAKEGAAAEAGDADAVRMTTALATTVKVETRKDRFITLLSLGKDANAAASF